MEQEAANPFVHLELHTGNLGRACAFYGALFGWGVARVEAGCGTYVALEPGGGLECGVVECAVEGPLWLPYVGVDEIGSATEQARGLGAAILLEPREGPAGWRSVISSPGAGQIALWQPKG
jgi:predicted enzyme related to lactoylglutathione lyase